MRALDLAGKRFGRLVAISADRPRGRYGWHCACDCGGHAFVVTAQLTTGHTQSCGCIRREACSALGSRTAIANSRKGAAKAAATRTRHGRAKDGSSDRTYSGWESMIQRCHNPNSKKFHLYGGRGITVCDRWRSFENFSADMGDRPAGMTLDRIDGARGYEPSNCRWATYKEQARNTSRNVFLEHNGQRRCVAEWSDITGIARDAIRGRLSRGWSTKQALTLPVGSRRSYADR